MGIDDNRDNDRDNDCDNDCDNDRDRLGRDRESSTDKGHIL